MAQEQAVWGIDIGQSALKAIRIQYDPIKQQAEALGFDYIEHPKILSQPDADPDELIRQALATFLSRNEIKGYRVCISVPGQSGLARFIKLPPVEPGRIPEIVRYEARQQIPFALDEVVWDYQVLGKKDEEEEEEFLLEIEVGLFAMKRELIQRYMSPFLEAGVEVDVVQMRPLALYNLSTFEMLAQRKEEEEKEEEEGEYKREELLEKQGRPQEEFILLLDIGADSSDLVITNGTQIWQRNLPIGGNHFTRALTKELKLTFAKAEHLKRNATKAQNPRAVFQAMRPVFNDLVSEVQRSVGYFASVHRQSKISRIVGLGNAFKLPGLQKFLSQNLHYEVQKLERFNRLTGASVLKSPVFQENTLGFGAAYGLALQGTGVSPIQTNLLPPEIARARIIRAKKPWMLTAAAALLVGFTVLFAGNWTVLHAVNRPEYGPAEGKAKQALQLQSQKKQQFEQAKASWTTVKSTGETLTSIVDERLAWLQALKAINEALPQNPANIDREQVRQLQELQITDLVALWVQDVKSEWFDPLLQSNQWLRGTIHQYDVQNPPSGPGWIFQLYGHHFNEQGVLYTLDALHGLQGAKPRLQGLSAPGLTYNVTIANWAPGTPTQSPRPGQRGRLGGGLAGTTRSGAFASSVMAGSGPSLSSFSSGGMSSAGEVVGAEDLEENAGSAAGSTGQYQMYGQSDASSAGMMQGASGAPSPYGSQQDMYRSFGGGVAGSSASMYGAGYAPMAQQMGQYGGRGRTSGPSGWASGARRGTQPIETKIKSLARTDFIVEFVWQPDKKRNMPPAELAAEQKKLQAALDQMTGPETGVSQELLQQSIREAPVKGEESQQPAAAAEQPQVTGKQAGSRPPDANATPGAKPGQ